MELGTVPSPRDSWWYLNIFKPSKTCPQDSQNDVNIWENIWENQVESSQISQKGIERS